jgi:hypothetical protein
VKSKKGNTMLRTLALLMLCLPRLALAVGSVTYSTQQINQNGTAYMVTINWVGDASTGTVPTTVIGGLGQVQGMQITQFQTIPGSTAPTASYSVTVKDVNNYDMMEGQGAGLSATASASFATSSAVHPVVGSLTFALTGNSVASANGRVLIYLFKPSVLAAANLLGRYGSGTGAVSSVFSRTGAVVAAGGDYTASEVTNVPAGNISAVTVQAAIAELDSEKQATGNYLTALTGDGTASGPGSAALTLATVNSNVGSCGDATHVCQVTLNAKGLATAASAVAIGAGTVTVVGSGSLTSTALVTGGGTTTLQTPAATATMDASGNISTPGSISTGVGGSNAGGVQFSQGTANTPGSNAIVIQAPTSVTTSYTMALPGAAGTGFLLNTDTSNVGAITFVSTIPVARGGTNLTAATDDEVMIGNGTTWQSKAIPNCTDTGGQHLNYTTSTNTLSCGTSGGGSTPPTGGVFAFFGYFYVSGGVNFTGGVANAGAWYGFTSPVATIDEIQYEVETAAASGKAALIGIFAVTAGEPSGSELCYWRVSGSNVESTGYKTTGAPTGGSAVSGGHCSLTMGGTYALAFSSDDTGIKFRGAGLGVGNTISRTKYSHLPGGGNGVSTGSGGSIAFTTPSGWGHGFEPLADTFIMAINGSN